MTIRELAQGRHPSVVDAVHFFKSDHLRPVGAPHVEISQKFEDTATWLLTKLDDDPELTRALHKLMEAKDCAVRAAVRQMERDGRPAEPNAPEPVGG